MLLRERKWLLLTKHGLNWLNSNVETFLFISCRNFQTSTNKKNSQIHKYTNHDYKNLRIFFLLKVKKKGIINIGKH